METKSPNNHDTKSLVPSKMSLAKWLIYILEGALIGIGAILPGISGGVLCTIFGIYRPMMELLAHPIKSFKKYYMLFIPVLIGWAAGFLLLSKLVAALLETAATPVTCLFIGLIVGMFPAMFKEANKKGIEKGTFPVFAVVFVVLLAFFCTLSHYQNIKVVTITPNTWWWIFCGALWGISLIVPGMSSSSLLLCLGLYGPMSERIGAMDFTMLIPWAVGIIIPIILLAKLVNRLFDKHHCITNYAIIAVVMASTIPIIPIKYNGTDEILLCVALATVGFVVAWVMEKFRDKLVQD